MAYINQLSAALLAYRDYQQINRKELAVRIGITARTVHELERGVRYPSLRTLRSITALMGWTVEEVGALILSLPEDPNSFSVEEYGGPDRQRVVVAERASEEDVVRGFSSGDWNRETHRLEPLQRRGDNDSSVEEVGSVA